jgi:hypothetical protein
MFEIILWWAIIPITLLCVLAVIGHIITRRKRAREDCAEYDKLIKDGYTPSQALRYIVCGEMSQEEMADDEALWKFMQGDFDEPDDYEEHRDIIHGDFDETEDAEQLARCPECGGYVGEHADSCKELMR